jgi:Tfp pilus assembly protein PilN
VSQFIDTIDLTPKEYRMGRKVKRRVAAWAAIAVTVSFAVFLTSASFQYRARELEAQVQPMRERVETMGAWSAKLVPLASQLETARNRRLIVDRLLKEPKWSALFSDIAAAAEGDLWLTGARVWKESVTDEESEQETEVILLALSGSASSDFEVIRFMTKLSESGHLSSLKLEHSRTREDDAAGFIVGFELQALVQ